MKNLRYKGIFLLVFMSGYFLRAQSSKGIPINLKMAVEKSISLKTPIMIGQYFIGVPYLANRLSRSNPEKVYYSFNDFDCVTYVENVLALYNSKGNYMRFKENIIKIRYNDFISYENRNHYLISGLEKLVKLNILTPINNRLNSKSVLKTINYLSEHVNNKHIDRLKLMTTEKSISSQPIYYFDSISDLDKNNPIQNGDVIAFVSSRNDLDFKHVGFVCIKNNKQYILHASQEKKVVCISDVTIDQYLLQNKKIKGFQIYRPNI
jgi:hypothetical protein